jgi:hypothetical protein
MEFITTDSKLVIEGKTIKQKRLTTTHKRNLLLYTFFFFFGLNLLIDKIDLARETGKISKWVLVVILSAILLGYVALILEYIFRRSWKNKIDILNVDKIKTFQSDEGLETSVELSLKSRRYKIYKFRILEKQVDGFVEALRSINPNTQLVIA